MPVPSEPKRSWGVLVLGASLLVGASGCAKKSDASRAPDNEVDAGYAQAPAGDELAQLEAYEAQLRDLGVKVRKRGKGKGKDKAEASKQDAGGGEGASVEDEAEAPAEDRDFAPPAEEEVPDAAPAPAAASEGMDAPMAELAEDDGESRCVSLCTLSEAICSLEARICEMSEDHPDDDTYVDACERAIDDCAVSGDACNTCDP